MSDLRVDFGTLEESHATALSLKAQFDALPHRVDDSSSSWGHHRVADAMHTFATNWGYHREVLSGKIQEVGEKIEACLETFKDADQKLYDQVTEHEAAR